MSARDPIDDVIEEAERTRGAMPLEADPEFQPAAWAAAPRSKRPPARIPQALASGSLLIVFVIIGLVFHRRESPSDESRFRVAAAGLVKQNLKSPATAQFAPEKEWSFDQIDPHTWRMKGWVDSENSFSALLRNRFTTIVRSEDGDWRLVYLKFEGSDDSFGKYLLTPSESAAEQARVKAELSARWDTIKAQAEVAAAEQKRIAAASAKAESDRRAAEAAAWKKMREQLDDVRARSK